jgi:hypothetical protein
MYKSVKFDPARSALLFVATFLLTAAIGSAGRATAQRPISWAEVIRLSNKVQFKPNNGAKADLRLNEGSLVRMSSNTHLWIQPNTRNFLQRSGTSLYVIRPNNGGTAIVTPYGRAGIRGSALFVRVNEENGTMVIGALTNNPAGPMEIETPDGKQKQSLMAGQMAMVQGNIIARYEFDLNQFYRNSSLAQGFGLDGKSAVAGVLQGDAEAQATLQAVRDETMPALAAQAPIVGENVAVNPAVLSPSSRNLTPADLVLPPVAGAIDRGSAQSTPQITTARQIDRPPAASLPPSDVVAAPVAPTGPSPVIEPIGQPPQAGAGNAPVPAPPTGPVLDPIVQPPPAGSVTVPPIAPIQPLPTPPRDQPVATPPRDQPVVAPPQPTPIGSTPVVTNPPSPPTTPPGQDNRPTTPPGQDNRPTTPPGQDNRPTTPPGQDNRPTTPPGQDNRPTTPPGIGSQPTNPQFPDLLLPIAPPPSAGSGNDPATPIKIDITIQPLEPPKTSTPVVTPVVPVIRTEPVPVPPTPIATPPVAAPPVAVPPVAAPPVAAPPVVPTPVELPPAIAVPEVVVPPVAAPDRTPPVVVPTTPPETLNPAPIPSAGS